MTARTAKVTRKTRETEITVEVNLDGTGQAVIDTPLPFLSHMLDQIARHGAIDLSVKAVGDVEIDGTTPPRTLASCWRSGAHRARRSQGHPPLRRGHVTMDEALVTAAMDLSGRPFSCGRCPCQGQNRQLGRGAGGVFFEAFARSAQANLHVVLHEGHNLHHIVEISFKAFSRALRAAVELDPRAPGVPSTKGMLV